MMATALNLSSDAQMFFNRSRNYKNTFDRSENFFCPREENGKYDCPFFKTDVFDSRYVEGDACKEHFFSHSLHHSAFLAKVAHYFLCSLYLFLFCKQKIGHYRFNAPFDPQGLTEMYGSKEALIASITFFYEFSKLDPSNALPNPYYWAGNEEDLFVPHLASLLGEPQLTQEFVTWMRENKYTSEPSGLPGNDDYGYPPKYTPKAFLSLSHPFFSTKQEQCRVGSSSLHLDSTLFPPLQYIPLEVLSSQRWW